MGKNESKVNSSFNDDLQKLKNENQTLKDEVAKNSDPNAKPRTIKRGNQTHPKYQKNKTKIPATL